MHYIITGEIDSGKSTFLERLSSALINNGIEHFGWISKGYYEDGIKAGYDLKLLDQQDRKPIKLARLKEFKDSFQWRKFWFNRSAFELTDTVKNLNPKLLIIDEIGPLELLDKKGFYDISRWAYIHANTTITVIRENMLEIFTKVFHDTGFEILPMDLSRALDKLKGCNR